MTVRVVTPDVTAIREAAGILAAGGLVGLPTETVYGLAANAENDAAVAGIFAAKNRPAINPLIVHVENLAMAEIYALFDDHAREIAAEFWPGALTLVLPLRPGHGLSRHVTAGLETVAIRCPAHPVAMALLRAFGRGIAAPSANRSGSLSPTTPQHVVQSLGDSVSMILAAGKCAVGLESTILDLSTPLPAILRHGAVTRADLAPFLGEIADAIHTPDAPKSPGQLLRHYAPRLKLRLNAEQALAHEVLLAFGPILGKQATPSLNLSGNGDINEAAANLFDMLHQLDHMAMNLPHISAIAVMPIPETGIGFAINDRLRRAAESH